jgi:Transposase DDE domain group 1
MRLILHTAAYWLMLDLRDKIPKTHALALAEFATSREKLLKIGARVVETASRIRLALATDTPACFGIWLAPCSARDPERRGRQCPCAPFTHPGNPNAFEKYGSTQRQKRNAKLRPKSNRA